jgi:SynChlorMet cassette radical SAM/SPASM protein ScmF
MPEYPLSQLYFYLTEGCNLACRHCWLAPKLDANANRYPTLPVEMFEGILAEAKPLGLTGVRLTGGEPLLHPQIERLLEIVRREALSLTVQTNGLLCTPALAEQLAQIPQSFVTVSLDGVDAETHDWVRGQDGAFVAALLGIRNLVAAGFKPQIIFAIMRRNAGQVEALIHLAEQLGAGSIKFNVVQPMARGETLHAANATLSVAELIALGRHVETELAPKTRLQVFFDYPMAFRPLRRFTEAAGAAACSIHYILGVLPDGHYALCGIGEDVPELVFGQAGQDTLETVWRENAVLQALRAGLPNQLSGICRRCLMQPRCRGYCIAQNYYRAHDLFAPFWFCEAAEAQGLFPASRKM